MISIGHGCIDDFPHNKDIAYAVEYIYEKNKGCVASICHGQLGLLDAKLKNGSRLLSGKMVCAFTNEEEESLGLLDKVKVLTETAVEDAGAICMPSAPWRATAVVIYNFFNLLHYVLIYLICFRSMVD